MVGSGVSVLEIGGRLAHKIGGIWEVGPPKQVGDWRLRPMPHLRILVSDIGNKEISHFIYRNRRKPHRIRRFSVSYKTHNLYIHVSIERMPEGMEGVGPNCGDRHRYRDLLQIKCRDSCGAICRTKFKISLCKTLVHLRNSARIESGHKHMV